MKKLLSIFLVLVLGATVSYADTHEADSVIAHENSLIITNAAAVGDPSEGAITDANIFDMTISNNDFDGFVLTFQSANAGALRLATDYALTKTGTWTEYSLDFAPGTTLSDLGYSTGDVVVDLDLGDNTTAADKTITYTGPSSAVNDGAVEVNMDIALDADMFEGTFEDVITVSISDYAPAES